MMKVWNKTRCPFSPVLFNTVLEVLAPTIKQEKEKESKLEKKKKKKKPVWTA